MNTNKVNKFESFMTKIEKPFYIITGFLGLGASFLFLEHTLAPYNLLSLFSVGASIFSIKLGLN